MTFVHWSFWTKMTKNEQKFEHIEQKWLHWTNVIFVQWSHFVQNDSHWTKMTVIEQKWQSLNKNDPKEQKWTMFIGVLFCSLYCAMNEMNMVIIHNAQCSFWTNQHIKKGTRSMTYIVHLCSMNIIMNKNDHWSICSYVFINVHFCSFI